MALGPAAGFAVGHCEVVAANDRVGVACAELPLVQLERGLKQFDGLGGAASVEPHQGEDVADAERVVVIGDRALTPSA